MGARLGDVRRSGDVFWNSLSPADREEIEEIGAERTYGAGTILFLEHEGPTHAVVILSGRVKLTRTSVDGREIIIELLGPGDLLGELGAIDGVSRSTTATTLEDLRAIVVPAAQFQHLLTVRGSIAMAVLTVVARKLRQATDRRLTSGTSDVLSRLCGRLAELAEKAPAGPDGLVEIDPPLTQQELAEWVGVSRDAVVLALKQLRKDGLITTGRRSIRVTDLDALRLRAAQRAG